jgi:hypothetical protein
VGLRFAPPTASRREVGGAVEAAWRGHGAKGAPPKLLVCEGGAAVVVVDRGREREARAALDGAKGAVSLSTVVTSGTISAVKRRLAVKAARR